MVAQLSPRLNENRMKPEQMNENTRKRFHMISPTAMEKTRKACPKVQVSLSLSLANALQVSCILDDLISYLYVFL